MHCCHRVGSWQKWTRTEGNKIGIGLPSVVKRTPFCKRTPRPTHIMPSLRSLVNPLCWLLMHDNLVSASILYRAKAKLEKGSRTQSLVVVVHLTSGRDDEEKLSQSAQAFYLRHLKQTVTSEVWNVGRRYWLAISWLPNWFCHFKSIPFACEEVCIKSDDKRHLAVPREAQQTSDLILRTMQCIGHFLATVALGGSVALASLNI